MRLRDQNLLFQNNNNKGCKFFFFIQIEIFFGKLKLLKTQHEIPRATFWP